METQISFTFQVRRFVPPEQEQYANPAWIMSAGRWQTHLEAVVKAGEWLKHMAENDPQQYELQIVQVEELELLP